MQSPDFTSSALAIPPIGLSPVKISIRYPHLLDSGIPSEMSELIFEIMQIEESESITNADQSRLDFLVDVRTIYENMRRQKFNISELQTIEPDELYALCTFVDPRITKSDEEVILLVETCREEMTNILRLIIQCKE